MRFLRRIKCVPVVCGTAMFVGMALQNGRFGVCGRTQYEMKDVFVREVTQRWHCQLIGGCANCLREVQRHRSFLLIQGRI